MWAKSTKFERVPPLERYCYSIGGDLLRDAVSIGTPGKIQIMNFRQEDFKNKYFKAGRLDDSTDTVFCSGVWTVTSW